MNWKNGLSSATRVLACIAATAALALGTPSSALAAPPAVGEIRVTVPTEVSCALMPDGTVVPPTNLSVENTSDCQPVVMDAFTADSHGHMVDFTLDAGGTRVITRTGGHDAVDSDWIDLGSLTSAGLDLDVAPLTRQSNAALIDAAAEGSADMFQLGFTFNLKELRESVEIIGDPVVGSELTAEVKGSQADAELHYSWMRNGTEVQPVEDWTGDGMPLYAPGWSDSFIAPAKQSQSDSIRLIFTVKYDPDGGSRTTVSVFDENGEFFDGGGGDDVGQVNPDGSRTYEFDITPLAGQKVYITSDTGSMDSANPYPENVELQLTSSHEIAGGAGTASYIPSFDDVGITLTCVVTDSNGKYSGELVSQPTDPIRQPDLTGKVAISGDPTVGETLTANVTGAQDDAELSYQWYRVQKTIPLCEDVDLIGANQIYECEPFMWPRTACELHVIYGADTYDPAAGHTLFDVRLSNGAPFFGLIGYSYAGKEQVNKVDPSAWSEWPAYLNEPVTARVLTALGPSVPDPGEQSPRTQVDKAWVEVIGEPEPYPIEGATGRTYTTTTLDRDADLICKVTDASGKYEGTLTSDPFGPISNLPKTAFAVFSTDDNSLNFYKRHEVPEVGSHFEGKVVTKVFTDVEDVSLDDSQMEGAGSYEAPWQEPDYDDDGDPIWPHYDSVTVVDGGIRPKNLTRWFYGLGLTTIDIAKLDLSGTEAFANCFSYNSGLRVVKVPGSEVVRELPIHHAGGKWVNSQGIAFDPIDIPTDVADTYTYHDDYVPEKPEFTGSVTFPPQAEVADDKLTTTIHISYTYSPRDAVAGVVKYEVADDANGTNAREVAVDKNILQEPVWGKYMRITIADTSGKYEGSASSAWVGPMTTDFYGKAEFTTAPLMDTRPGYHITGPVLVNGQSDFSNYDIRWEIADDADGTNARPHDDLNSGGYLAPHDVGKYLHLVVSAKAPYSTYVPGSIASEWTLVGHPSEIDPDGKVAAPARSVMAEEAFAQVLITSHGETTDE